MMKFVHALVMLLSSAFASTLACAAPPKIDPARTVVIAGPIVSNNIAPLAAALDKFSSTAPKEPVNIIIASPGGNVIDGFLFINQMEAIKDRGTEIRCFVPVMAASMAFQILLHCDSRYTLDYAFLLWHRVRVSGGDGPITAPMALNLAAELERLDKTILRDVVENMDLDENTIRYHFERETLHVGHDLAEMDPGFITSYKAIPGLVEAMNTSLRSKMPLMRLFDYFKPGEIVYMWQGAK